MSAEFSKQSVLGMAASAVSQVQSLPSLSPAAAGEINQAILASKFPEQVKQHIAKSVADKFATMVHGADASKDGQFIAHPYNYLTESDWVYIRDLSKTSMQVAVRLRQRLALCGFHKPSQLSFKSLAGLLAAAREPDMTQVRLHALVMDLKAAQTSEVKTTMGPTHFPIFATDLPADKFDAAYAEEPPAPLMLVAFTACVDRCPLRSSHKSLKDSSSHALVVRDVGGAAAAPSSAHAFFETMMSSFAQRFVGDGRRMALDSQVDAADVTILTPIGGASPPTPGTQLVRTDSRLDASPRALPALDAAAMKADAETQLVEVGGEDGDATPDDIVAFMERSAGGWRNTDEASSFHEASRFHGEGCADEGYTEDEECTTDEERHDEEGCTEEGYTEDEECTTDEEHCDEGDEGDEGASGEWSEE